MPICLLSNDSQGFEVPLFSESKVITHVADVMRSLNYLNEIVREGHAMEQVTYESMIQPPFDGGDGGGGGEFEIEIPVPIDGEILSLVAKYLNGTKVKLNCYDVNVLIKLLEAADYLQIGQLMILVGKEIASVIRKKPVAWFRRNFGIERDLSVEDFEKLAREHLWAWTFVDWGDDKEHLDGPKTGW